MGIYPVVAVSTATLLDYEADLDCGKSDSSCIVTNDCRWVGKAEKREEEKRFLPRPNAQCVIDDPFLEW